MIKQLLFLTAILLGTTSIAQITSFPYSENFESGNGGWTPSGTLWQVGIPSTPLMTVANTNCINNAFVTNLTGNYSNSANNTLTSPVFDFSSFATDPSLRFDIFRELESCCDEVWVEMSTDGGTTWNKVIGPGQNWYNDLGNQWWDNNTSGWQTAMVTLPGTAGIANVQLRFYFSSDGSVTQEGVGVDNITINDGTYTDLELVEVLSPTSGYGFGSNEPIIVVIANNGTTTVPFTDYAICYNGDLPQACETTITNIPGNTLDTLVLLGTADMSAPGIYDIDFYLSMLAPDSKPCNDTLSIQVNVLPVISNFPYLEDFEAGNGDWFTFGLTWEHGLPTTPLFSSANSNCSNNAIVTNLDGFYDNSLVEYIYTPIFDFSGIVTDPIIKFDMFRDLENCCDETWVEMTTDGGTTWQKVMGPGLNWYNDLGNQWWDNNTTAWTETSAQLTGAAGSSDVQIRFVMSSDGSVTREGVGIDNVYIGDANFFELELVEVISPLSTPTCTSLPTSEAIEVVIRNNGTATANFTDYAICFNGDFPQTCETTIIDIAAGATDTITLLSAANFTMAGTYNVNYYLSTSSASVKPCNDSLTVTYTINELPFSNLPDTAGCGSVLLTTYPADSIIWSTGTTSATETFTTSGLYTVELHNIGCAVVMDTVSVTIYNATAETDTVFACGSYTWIDSNTYTTSNNTATHTLTNSFGCDSLVVTLNLTIANPSTATDVQVACGSYTWIDSNTYTASNNTATWTITNSAGCDSVITLDLTINTVNVSTTTTDFTISADLAGMTYQWIDCDNNNAPIAGETSQSFTATANGNYAVVITDNGGCTDTSACVAITNIGLSENLFGTDFNLYPNPTNGDFVVEFSDVQDNISITVYSVSGQIVSTTSALETKRLEMTIEEPAGIYLVELKDQYNQKAIVRVVKK